MMHTILCMLLAPLTDVCAPLHALSNWSAVFHFVLPLTDMHIPLHAPSDRSVVFHFVASLTDVRVPLHAPPDRPAVFHFVSLLELSRTDAYVTYPYLESHESREPVPSRLLPLEYHYMVTSNHPNGFLRYLASVTHLGLARDFSDLFPQTI